MTFWSGLSERERRLVTIAAGLLVIVAGYLGVWRPLQAASLDADRDLAAARALHASVTADARRLAAAERPAGPTNRLTGVDGLRQLAGARARDRGLVVTRLQPQGDGELTFWFEGVDPLSLQGWLAGLSEDAGVEVIRLSITRTGQAATVRAQVTLSPGSEA